MLHSLKGLKGLKGLQDLQGLLGLIKHMIHNTDIITMLQSNESASSIFKIVSSANSLQLCVILIFAAAGKQH